MKTKKRKTRRNPTPAQIRARKAFARMAKERARLARAKNKTIIKAKRVKIVQTNPKRKAAKKAIKKTIKRAARVSPKSREQREQFTGKKSTKTLSLMAPTGAPNSFAILGRLKSIKTRGRKFSPPVSRKNPGGGVYLAESPDGKLHVIGDPLPLLDQRNTDFGPINEIEYYARKPHLGYPETTEFFHKMGEESGIKPHLVTDKEGALWIKGGDYFVTERGIENPSRPRSRKKRVTRRVKNESPVVKAMIKVEPDALIGALVSLTELRRAMKSQYRDKKSFDKAIIAAAEREDIRLHRHVFPSSLTQKERDDLVYSKAGGRDNYFIGAQLNLKKIIGEENPRMRRRR